MSLDNLRIGRTSSSCAVQEITGVSYLDQKEVETLLNDLKIKKGVVKGWGGEKDREVFVHLAVNTMYFFADRTGDNPHSMYPGHGKLLVEEIKKRKLGTLWETHEFVNKGNNNKCIAWLWWLDEKSWEGWKKDQNKDKESSVIVAKPLKRKVLRTGTARLLRRRPRTVGLL